jgi:hypothetical protein
MAWLAPNTEKIVLKSFCRSAIISKMEDYMSKIVNYTAELEHLIVNTLLPAYEDYCRRYPFSKLAKEINYDIIREIKHTRDCGALLKPRKNLS